jgi:hypothetical protein
MDNRQTALHHTMEYNKEWHIEIPNSMDAPK